MELEFEVARAERGFTNTGLPPSAGGGDVRSRLNYNGTFFNNADLFPHLGYNQAGQIIDRNERRKRGLGDVPRAAKLEDESARDSMGFADADWINFETIVSTSADQIALAPGYLQREWTRRRPALFPLQDGPADAAVLLLPVGALAGEARRVARTCRSRSITTPSIRTTSTA